MFPVVFGVKRLHSFFIVLVNFVEEFRIFILEVGGIHQHNAREILGLLGAMNGALKAQSTQQR